MQRKQLKLLLTVLFIVDGFIIGALLSATRSWQLGVPVGFAVMLFPFALVALIIGGTMRMGGWGRLASAYPAVEPAPGTKAKMAEQMVIGKVPMNNSVEYAVDDDHLHLTPLMTLGSWCPAVSIPWAAVSFPDDGREAKASLLKAASVLIDAADVRMRVPPEVVRRELEVRAALRGAEESGGTLAT